MAQISFILESSDLSEGHPLFDGEFSLKFEISADVSAYVPAKICGPPENCYPAEGGEVEITSVRLTSTSYTCWPKAKAALEAIFWELLDQDGKFRERIEERLFQEAQKESCWDYND